MPALTTRVPDPIAAGDEVPYVFTLRKPLTAAQRAAGTTQGDLASDISGAVVTASIQSAGSATNIITGHAMSVVSGVGATVSLTLTEAESVLLTGGADPRQTEDYLIDITVVLAGAQTTYGPVQQPVRSVVGSV